MRINSFGLLCFNWLRLNFTARVLPSDESFFRHRRASVGFLSTDGRVGPVPHRLASPGPGLQFVLQNCEVVV